MEKYIIILVILATIYYIQSKLLIEGFEAAPAQSLGGVDDTNAINTLAQISKQLMAGGITVPGNIIIEGDLVFPKPTTIKGAGRLHIGGEELLYILNKAGVMIGKEWGGNGNLTVQGNTTIGGYLAINGSLSPAHSVWHTSTDGKHRLHYGNNSHTFYKTADAHVWRNRDDHDRMVLDHGANLRVDGGLTVGGHFILNNPIYRKHDIAGYFHIRAYGWRTPLYYGFNMMWSDHNIKEAVRAKWGWNESMFSHSIHDMRQHGDPNWHARYLVVFPGYKIKIYSWDGSFIDRVGVRGAGEYPFGDGVPTIHGAFVSLAEEGDPPERINW